MTRPVGTGIGAGFPAPVPLPGNLLADVNNKIPQAGEIRRREGSGDAAAMEGGVARRAAGIPGLTELVAPGCQPVKK